MQTLIALAIGIFIGWNLPQPPWAKAIQAHIVNLIRALTRRPFAGP